MNEEAPPDVMPGVSAPITVEELDDLTVAISAKKAEIEAKTLEVTALNKEFQTLQARAVSYLRELGRESFPGKGGTIGIRQVFSVKMPADDTEKAKLWDWMREKGIYDKYATVHAAALTSLVKNEREVYLQDGGDPMLFGVPGLESPKIFETLSFTKGRK